jgi:hypothetical protein
LIPIVVILCVGAVVNLVVAVVCSLTGAFPFLSDRQELAPIKPGRASDLLPRWARNQLGDNLVRVAPWARWFSGSSGSQPGRSSRAWSIFYDEDPSAPFIAQRTRGGVQGEMPPPQLFAMTVAAGFPFRALRYEITSSTGNPEVLRWGLDLRSPAMVSVDTMESRVVPLRPVWPGILLGSLAWATLVAVPWAAWAWWRRAPLPRLCPNCLAELKGPLGERRLECSGPPESQPSAAL